MKQIRDYFPRIYHPFLPDLFKNPIPAETLADCENCSMCAGPDASTYKRLVYFSPKTKCCTYYPPLPNYMAGALLAGRRAADREAKRRVKAIIARRRTATPFGLLPPAAYTRQYRKVFKKRFGREESLLCPYLNEGSGSCGVWPYRHAVCATWFCKYVSGIDGHRFWSRVRLYLMTLETALARYALRSLDWKPDLPWSHSFISREFRQPNKNRKPENLFKGGHRELWTAWAGREEELYVKAFRLVKQLTAADVEKLPGRPAKKLLSGIDTAYRQMISPRLPRSMTVGPCLKIRKIPGGNLLAQSDLTCLEMPPVINRALHLFNGNRSMETVNRLLKKQEGVTMERDLVVSLYQNRMLVKSNGLSGARSGAG